MKLHALNTGFFKLDGGAMFGVVPKTLWQGVNPPDANNMCTWAMRSLLIEDGNRLFLIDTGIGEKQSEKFFSFYDLHGPDSLDKSLQKKGFSRDDVTDVFLTHLHFDHCGGAIERNPSSGLLEPAFRNAQFWSNKAHWQWATQPNAREKASFLKENILPIEESGQLQFLPTGPAGQRMETPLGMEFITVNGHTDGQMLPVLNYKGQTIIFAADLLPSAGHVPLAWVMGYDTRPVLTLQEKEAILTEAATNNHLLFLEHDPVNEVCTVQHTERGVRLGSTGTLESFLG